MTLVSWGLVFLILAGIAGLFAFGVFGTRRTLPFRVMFYVLVAMFVATVVVGISQRPPMGYDPTPDHPSNR
jgi:uncharacterized membrane protein YtjA (UPF0391 family)